MGGGVLMAEYNAIVVAVGLALQPVRGGKLRPGGGGGGVRGLPGGCVFIVRVMQAVVSLLSSLRCAVRSATVSQLPSFLTAGGGLRCFWSYFQGVRWKCVYIVLIVRAIQQ